MNELYVPFTIYIMQIKNTAINNIGSINTLYPVCNFLNFLSIAGIVPAKKTDTIRIIILLIVNKSVK